VLALAAVSVLYPVRILRRGWEKAPVRSLREVPGSKDIFMALGWGALLVMVPLARHGSEITNVPAVITALVMVMGLVFVRALLRDFRDIQADRLIGRETVPIVLGVPRTRSILYLTLMTMAGIMLLAATAGFVPAPLGYLLLIPLAYAATMVPLFTRQTIVQGFGAESLIDTAFLIAGVVTIIS
jgi:4-hydroxy-3-methylbut-2-enyl diphosphate reductase